MGFKDLRSYLQALEKAGLLHKIDKIINKDSELMPLVRWQYRGLPPEIRKAFLFTRVTDGKGRKYDSNVVVSTIGASRKVFAFALGCSEEELRDTWLKKSRETFKPIIVDKNDAPVKEEIHCEEDISKSYSGLDIFPIPNSTPGFDPAPFITAGHWITTDMVTGKSNIGNYRAMRKGTKRLGLQLIPTQHIGIHMSQRKEKGLPLEAAVIIGTHPAISMVAVSKIPYGQDEYEVAGGLAGAPIRLVKCETINVYVPADAEIVLEGKLRSDYVEEEGPFGEFSGYMGEKRMHPVLEITCITHRKNPIYQAFISQFPPSESSLVRNVANEAEYYDLLKNKCNIPSVHNIVFHECGCAHHLVVIQMGKQNPAQPWQALRATAALDPTYGKIIIAVDEDIDPNDLDSVVWALATRTQPHLDIEIIQGRASMLDPSGAPPTAPSDEVWYPKPKGLSGMLIDATRKWPYLPVSLPAREFMERAREIWNELGLPALQAKNPWFGYTLGPWPEEYIEEAQKAAKSEYYENI